MSFNKRSRGGGYRLAESCVIDLRRCDTAYPTTVTHCHRKGDSDGIFRNQKNWYYSSAYGGFATAPHRGSALGPVGGLSSCKFPKPQPQPDDAVISELDMGRMGFRGLGRIGSLKPACYTNIIRYLGHLKNYWLIDWLIKVCSWVAVILTGMQTTQ